MLNKLISIIIVLSIILCYVGYAESDYSSHWAKSSIEYLVKKGTVSGDSNGIRPDDSIKTAEIAKIINLEFGYTKMPDLVFPGISSNKWYYEDINIAKQAGYIIGDEKGNPNPEQEMSRERLCVILTRIIGLPEYTGNNDMFSDEADISSWALPSVKAMAENKLITGYSDGSFRGGSSVTRAEAFTVIVRIEEYLAERIELEKEKEETPSGHNPIGISSPSSSGGGGGGGGGGSYTPETLILSAPSIISINSDECKLSVQRAEHVVSYVVKIERETENGLLSKEVVFSGESVDISSALKELTGADKNEKEKFYISVKAVASAGYIDSVYSSKQLFIMEREKVSVPEDIRCVAEFDEEGNETLKITWSAAEHADSYEVILKNIPLSDGTLEDRNLSVSGCEAVIPADVTENLGPVAEISFKGNSNNEEILSSEITPVEIDIPLYGGVLWGSNIISNERHFKNIKYDTSGSYVLTNDITLDNYEPFSFSGELKGESGAAHKIIRVNIENNESTINSPVGLFTFITGQAKLSNIRLKGKISGKDYVGGFAGIAGTTASKLSSGAEISNCINEAVITATGSNVGGFVSRAYFDGSGGENLKITGCVNKGAVSGKSSVAGIISVSAADVSLCGNYGSITASSDYAGGIAGQIYGDIITSFNAGKIAANRYSGGIVGCVSYHSIFINDCFNTGEISASTGLGGILGGILTTGNRGVTINNSYNTFVFENVNNSIYPDYTKTDTISISASDCFYLSDMKTADNKEETTPLTSDEMQNLSSFNNFSSSVWHINTSRGYLFPQLIGAEYTDPSASKINFNLSANCYVEDSAENYVVTWDQVLSENYSSYNIELRNEAGTEIIDTINTTENSYTLPSYAELNKKYSFMIEAVSSDGEDKSEPNEFVFSTSFAGGDGTVEKPYIIKNNRHFDNIRYELGKVYEVVNDIVLSDSYEPFECFEGTLKGVNESGKVKITVNLQTEEAVPYGLFKTASSVVIISNIELDGTIYAPNAYNVGGFIGKAVGTLSGSVISDCVNSVDITAKNAIGGFVGRNYSGDPGNNKLIFTSLVNRGEIKGENTLGGICAVNSGKISRCANYGRVIRIGSYNNDSFIGGIVGNNYASSISECFNFGELSGYCAIGGIVGRQSLSGTIENCFNSGTVNYEVTTSIGGIAGAVNTSYTVKMKNSYNSYELSYGAGILPLGPVSVNYTNCYYITTTNYDDNIPGTELKTVAELEVLDTLGDAFELPDSESEYKYPVLKNNSL